MKPAASAKTGIYVRESRDDNEENYETIETQRDLLLNFVNQNKLGEIHRIYIDDNVSGSMFERNGLEQLKGDIFENRINLLVMKDLSRLGRNNAKTLLFLDFLEENGVRVITFDGKYDSLKDNDTVGIETWFNERYIRDISKKIRANLRFKIERGEYIGHAPYGYLKSTELKNKLCIDNNTAHIIKEIFGLYKEGYGYSFIAKHLNSKDYPPPSEKCSIGSAVGLWNSISIKRILGNRVYIGDTVQGISEKVSFKSKKTRRLPPEKWVITPNTHEGIISREEFEEVRKIRAGKTTITGNHKGEIHLLKSIMYCGKCGSTMFARIRSNRSTGYVCGNYFRTGIKACTSHYIKEKDVEKILLDELTELYSDKSTTNKAVNLLEKKMEKESDIPDRLVKLEQNILSKQRQQDVLYMDKLEGKISEQLFIRMNVNIENRISQLRHEIEKEKNRNSESLDIYELVLNSFKHINEKGLTNEMIRMFVEKILVFDKGDDLNKFEIPGLSIEQKVKAEEKGAILIEFKHNP